MEKRDKKFEALFQPITIGRIEIRNRIAMAPLASHQATPDGYVNNQVRAWFAARAKGGTGLIITSPVFVYPKFAEASSFFNLRLYQHRHKAGMSDLAEIIHDFGAKIVAQLAPGGGRQSGGSSPSAVPIEFHPDMTPEKTVKEHEKRGLRFGLADFMQRLHGVVPPVLSIEEIIEIENYWANGVLLAGQCGFDGVELHFAHGHLGYSFLSPRMNKRNDLYGGSFENRIRFMLNVLNKARDKVGRDFCIGIRVNGEEHMPGGLTHNENKKICQQVEKLVDYIHLSDGCYEVLKYPFPDEDGTMLKYAESLKKILKIPVITPSIHAPELAARAIESGKTDMVALGRPLITDPDWANKVAAGRKPVKCIRCNIGCLRWIGTGLPLRCIVNLKAGLEEYIPEYLLSRPFKKHWYHE